MRLNKLKYIHICYLMVIIIILVALFLVITDKKQNKELKKNTEKKEVTKYILLWTNPKHSPFVYFGEGHYNEFDVIAFNGPELNSILNLNDLPRSRNVHQKYVYANIESPEYYPICTEYWNNFFNWTWTFKLNSDALWGYISIKNASNNVVVGPKTNMQWINIDDMDSIDYRLKEKLKTKSRAAAWFVSNCNTFSQRETYVKQLTEYLDEFYLELHIYGSCGSYICPIEIMNKCLLMLEKNYYFYFAFENSISDDYVTEKILYALNHFTVPVVYGGANYSRFIPPGSYLDAITLGPKKLAQRMYEAIKNPIKYQDFFKWKKYYNYDFRHKSPETDDYCNFCAMINNDNLIKTTSIYERIDLWWTPNHTCRKD